MAKVIKSPSAKALQKPLFVAHYEALLRVRSSFLNTFIVLLLFWEQSLKPSKDYVIAPYPLLHNRERILRLTTPIFGMTYFY